MILEIFARLVLRARQLISTMFIRIHTLVIRIIILKLIGIVKRFEILVRRSLTTTAKVDPWMGEYIFHDN